MLGLFLWVNVGDLVDGCRAQRCNVRRFLILQVSYDLLTLVRLQ